MCKWCVLSPKKASNAVSNCQICKCSFSTKIGTGKLGRISTENQSQTSNREGSRATTLAFNVCFAVAILILNKLSHLSDRLCNSCWRRKVRNLFQLFHLVKNSTKEESVQSVQIVSFQTAITVFCFAFSVSQRSLADRKVFRIGLHATASKSSPRKALFSSVQEQSQHQPKGNFLEEHITYQVCLKLMKLK